MKFRFSLIILLLLIYTCDRQIMTPVRDNPFDSGNGLVSTDLFNIQTQNLSEHILISWEYNHEKPLLDNYLLYRVDATGSDTLIYKGIETAFEDSDVEWGSTYSYYVTGMLNDEESTSPAINSLPEVVRKIFVGANSEYTKIADALNALNDGVVIYVMNGVYVENIDFAGKKIKLVCNDEPGSCEIQGDGSGPVITFDGDEDTTAVLDGFKIKGSNSTQDGGAIYLKRGSGPQIKNCIFEENSSTGDGGAIYCYKDSSPLIENCTFTENEADGDGGAIFVYRSQPVITNCTFTGNKSNAGYGGAIYFNRSSDIVVEQSTFMSNEAEQGGAIFMFDSKNIEFKQSHFGHNTGDFGGGIYIEECDNEYKPIKFENCILWQNSSYAGGGMYSVGSEVRISYCTITENAATLYEGGALFFKLGIGTKVEIENSILWQNNAAIEPEINYDGTCTIDVDHSDIEGGFPGDGNINVDPQFEEESDGYFQLENDSDCIGTDSNSTQMGAWGNGVTNIGATEE